MNKRQRGRNRRQPNQNPNRSMDSNGPDVKVRGSATTIYEKYVTLARDARSAGSRVKAENHLQHAEHYLRIIQDQKQKAQAIADKNSEKQVHKQKNQNQHHNKNNAKNDATKNNDAVDDGVQANGQKQNQPNNRRHQNNDDQNRAEGVKSENVDSSSDADQTPQKKEAVDVANTDAAEVAPKKKQRRRKKPKQVEGEATDTGAGVKSETAQEQETEMSESA